MKITIEGEPKEIAALLVQAEARLVEKAAENGIEKILELFKQISPQSRLDNSSKP